MAYSVDFKPAAQRQIKKLSKEARAKVLRAIEALGQDPRPRGVEKLTTEEELYRIKAGHYRVIYLVEDAALLVLVVRIGQRKEVYRKLGRL